MADETTRLKGLIGGQAAGKLAEHRDLHTVGDLLRYWPTRYRTHESDLSRLRPGEYAVVVADVSRATTRPMQRRRGRMLTCTITDGQREIDLTFFSAYGHEGKLVPGVRGIFAGEVTQYRGQLQLAHPGYTLIEPGLDDATRGLIPIYRHVPKVHNWTIAECTRLVLDHLDHVTDAVPAQIRAQRSLVDRKGALRHLHVPRTFADVEAARHRMRYEEALVLQCVLGQRRVAQAAERTVPRPQQERGLLEAFDQRLPFELTEGQVEVGEVLAAEMARPTPMHRLLQGEVGSGKTVVALRAMLAAVDAGGQAALLAPTEVLAAQHHRSITAMLGDLAEGGMLGGSEIGTRVTLLTGSLSTAARRAALLDIVSGEAGIVIGTHALIQEGVDFHDLALVVVDEQHRFGVEQRDALRSKGAQPPHVLVMTATPIPRTVAMTVYGDMETSTLTQVPRGRQPVETFVVPEDKPAWVERTWTRLAEEVAAGRQAYVVCPRIGEEGEVLETEVFDEAVGEADDDSGASNGADADTAADHPGPDRPLASVLETVAQLRAHPALADLRIDILHGRMPAEEKEAVMTRFAAGEIDVLVATTVIEVGVDVPNASVMVIKDADRFGVSQLHQLRGRVGRGQHAGVCLLMSASQSDSARERLTAVAGTNDGFALSRLDLGQRREGDILGARQHGGHSQLEFLSLLRDEEIIIEAREDATALIATDPTLAAWPELAAAVAQRVDSEQAAYLEKG